MRMNVSHVPSEQAHSYDSRESAFFRLEDFKSRLRPDFAFVPLARGAQAPQARNGCRFLRKIFQLQTRQRCRARGYGEQRESAEKKNPQEAAALYVAHFSSPRNFHWITNDPLAAVLSRFVFWIKSVRAPGRALDGICSVMWIIPNPAGCFAITVTSPGPDTPYVILASSPLSENTQRSKVELPLAGLCSATGLPESEQELFSTENMPSAATLMSTSLPCALTPAVVGSTTTMSFPVADGELLLRAITSSEAFGMATTRKTALELLPSGFST